MLQQRVRRCRLVHGGSSLTVVSSRFGFCERARCECVGRILEAAPVARPGGNLTGPTLIPGALVGKQVKLLMGVVPKGSAAARQRRAASGLPVILGVAWIQRQISAGADVHRCKTDRKQSVLKQSDVRGRGHPAGTTLAQLLSQRAWAITAGALHEREPLTRGSGLHAAHPVAHQLVERCLRVAVGRVLDHQQDRLFAREDAYLR